MLALKHLKLNRFLIFPMAIGITQFMGINSFSIFLILMGGVATISLKIYLTVIKQNHSFIVFFIISVLIAIYNFTIKTPDFISFIVWTQFFFLAIFPLFISDKGKIFLYLKYVVSVIFLMDVITNLLLLIGFNLPWVLMTSVRPDEAFARFPGIKGNNLFSSLFSFLMFAISLDTTQIKQKKLRMFFLILAIINLILAGSRRSLILGLSVFCFYLIPRIRTSKFYLLTFFIALAIVIFLLNIITMESNPSNLLRYELWINSIANIMNKPFFGHGLFYPDLKNITATFEELSNVGVTESFMLSIAYCFGIPALVFFIIFNFKTLINSTVIHEYSAYMAIFCGLSIELYFGGSLENTIAGTLFFLSAAIINSNSKDRIYA